MAKLLFLMLVIASCSTSTQTLLECDYSQTRTYFGTVSNHNHLIETANCNNEGSTLVYCFYDVILNDSVDYVNHIQICGHHKFNLGDSAWLQNVNTGSKLYVNEYLCVGKYKYKIMK